MSEQLESPSPPPEFSLRSEDVAFIGEFNNSLQSIYHHVAEGPDRDSALYQAIHSHHDYLVAAERSGANIDGLKLTFFAEVMGVGPRADEASAAASELAKVPLLDDKERREVNRIMAITWEQRAKKTPPQQTAIALKRYVGNEIQFSQATGSAYEVALLAFLAGATIGQPELSESERLRKVLYEHHA